MPSLARIRMRFAKTIKHDESLCKNIFESILFMGDDHEFKPRKQANVTQIPPGKQKVDILRKRLEDGADLWCDEDAEIDLD